MRACFELFLADSDTHGVIVIGEIGGTDEEELAEFIKAAKPKIPVVALIVGRHAPAERRMGHAGAIAGNTGADAESKIRALRDAGVIIAESPHLVGKTMQQELSVVA
jgi:succinyl-CoA synthetase alpha subunit